MTPPSLNYRDQNTAKQDVCHARQDFWQLFPEGAHECFLKPYLRVEQKHPTDIFVLLRKRKISVKQIHLLECKTVWSARRKWFGFLPKCQIFMVKKTQRNKQQKTKTKPKRNKQTNKKVYIFNL